jgi:origin recognition complex subunit 4
MKLFDIHQKAEQELINVFKRLIDYGENNSALIIGPRGSGKTFLIKHAIKRFRDQLKRKNSANDFIVVYLAGKQFRSNLFIFFSARLRSLIFYYSLNGCVIKGCLYPDDKSALLEISKQLKLENVINNKVFGSFADSFEFLLRSFRAGDKCSKPLLFIMDEFDLFTKNKTQLLLYTLLNTIQTSQSPMCLIGATCRIDVLDLLEKRIKSRFSHRQIYVFNEYDLNKYIEMGKYFMECALDTNQMNQKYQTTQLSQSSQSEDRINETLEEFFKDNYIVKTLAKQYEYDKSLSTLRRLLILASLKLKSKPDVQSVKEEFARSYSSLNMDARVNLLSGVPTLELMLIVVIKELSERFIDEPFNFDLVYDEYLKFCNKSNLVHQKYEKQVILKVRKRNLT